MVAAPTVPRPSITTGKKGYTVRSHDSPERPSAKLNGNESDGEFVAKEPAAKELDIESAALVLAGMRTEEGKSSKDIARELSGLGLDAKTIRATLAALRKEARRDSGRPPIWEVVVVAGGVLMLAQMCGIG